MMWTTSAPIPLDALPQEYPTYGSGDYRGSALKVRYPDGTTSCELRYVGYEVLEGKYSIPGLPAIYQMEENKADTLVITLEDTRKTFYVHLYYGVMEDLDIITRSVRIENHSDKPVFLENVQSTCVDYLHGEFDLHTFYGRHIKERNYQRARSITEYNLSEAPANVQPSVQSFPDPFR